MSLAPNEIATLSSVEAELNYLAPTSGKPRTYTYDPPAGVPQTTIVNDPHKVEIYDARPIASTISLDAEGFGVLQHRSRVGGFHNEDEIRAIYYPETEELLKDVTGADRVFIFDHTVRRRVWGAEDRRPGLLRQPVARVHVDHTQKSGPQRVRDLLPEEAEDLLAGRVQIINLWRPIRGPVQDAPLAVCDALSVKSSDLVPADLIYRDRVGETYSVVFSPEHRWFYVAEMQPDEALLLKCYDSKTDARARFAPHSAFIDPSAPSNANPRESIEMRALVFHHA
jgi:hypothetical protein